ncbi:MAG: hypothetical protein WBF03_16380 [Xanthobacteraceae bacterium]
MRSQISYTVLAAALFGGASIANAQDVVTRPLPPGAVMRPAQTVETVPVETVETVQTVRSVGHAARRSNGRHLASHLARSRPETIVTATTRRTILGERVVPAPAVIAPAPALGTVAEPTYAAMPAPAYPPRLYDVATEPVFGAPIAPAYRYVYEPDRILVIDPATGIAVQAIPR